MRHLVLVLIGLLVVFNAAAIDKGIDGRVTAGHLVAFCSVDEDDADYTAAIAFCYGYLDAALDYHAALTASPKFNALICPPDTVTREAVAVNLVEWADDNAHKVGEQAPIHVIMEATATNWPCAAE